MTPLSSLAEQAVGFPVLFTLLPGPDRNRRTVPYRYRLTYRNREPEAAGCVMTWEVSGGRLLYQIALERAANGKLCCHCTCADAVYRGETEGHLCKHIQGLLEFSRPPRYLPQVQQRRGA
jgi:hypothetical protein